jgi:hypothetical protein
LDSTITSLLVDPYTLSMLTTVSWLPKPSLATTPVSRLTMTPCTFVVIVGHVGAGAAIQLVNASAT